MTISFESLFQQVYNLTGDLDPRLVVALFLLGAIGEFGLSVPCLMETVWLITGYQLVSGALSGLEAGTLFLTIQAGRQAGATTLFCVSRLGSTPLTRLYNKIGVMKLSQKLPTGGKSPFRFLHKMDFFSPFSVAFGRLLWLRVPLTLALGLKRKVASLAGGILLSSLAWDGLYISVGVIAGTNAVLNPAQMILYSLAGLTALYLLMFGTKFILGRLSAQYQKNQA